MKPNIAYIILCAQSLSFNLNAQSIELNPTNNAGLIAIKGGNISNMQLISKIGSVSLKIVGLKKTDNVNFFYTHGMANLELIGEPNSADFIGSTSNQVIHFKHNNTSRWELGDYYSDVAGNTDRFAIHDKTTFNSNPPFFINKGSGQVDIAKLRIASSPSGFSDGFLIQRGISGSMEINNQLDSPIHLQTNNLTRVALLPSGEFGIGTTDPQRKLDVAGTARFSETLEVTGNTTLSQNLIVNGTSKIGSNGSTLTQIIKTSSTFNLATILASSSVVQTVTVTNASVGSTVHISPGSALPDGIVIAYARVSTANTVEIKFTNVKTVNVDPPNITYQISIIR